MTRSQAWELLQHDAVYARLMIRKDRIGAAWNRADAAGSADSAHWRRLFARAVRKLCAYEDQALSACTR